MHHLIIKPNFKIFINQAFIKYSLNNFLNILVQIMGISFELGNHLCPVDFLQAERQ